VKFHFVFFSVFIFLAVSYSKAQTNKPSPGKIEVIQDPRVDVLINKHSAFHQNLKGYQGFRLQIFFDSGNNSKSRALSVKAEFLEKFSGTDAYLIYKEPNYKVRVGDFRNRLDAARFLHNIIEDFPNAFLVVDEIQLPKIDRDFGDED
jgi:hypothetical protein